MGRRAKLKHCTLCPREHPGWPTSSLRFRQKVPYCSEHIQVYKNKKRVETVFCEKCNENEWMFIWGGSEKNSKAVCTVCGFSTRAADLFSDLYIKTIAAPIERI